MKILSWLGLGSIVFLPVSCVGLSDYAVVPSRVLVEKHECSKV